MNRGVSPKDVPVGFLLFEHPLRSEILRSAGFPVPARA